MTVQHGRLPWPRPDELAPAARELYDTIVAGPRAAESTFSMVDEEGRLEGPFNAMLVNPAVGKALQSVGAAIRYRTTLTDREREIAILVLAVQRRSDFEWYAHERIGRRIGLLDAELAALLDATCPDTFTAAEACVFDITKQLLTDRDVDDDGFGRAESLLGLTKLADLVSLVGYYDHLALALRFWRTPLPDGAASPFGR